MRLPKHSADEIETIMVPRLIEALYPVLIPLEQQDCAIQEANHRKVRNVALQAWRSFTTQDKESALDPAALATEFETSAAAHLRDADGLLRKLSTDERTLIAGALRAGTPKQE